MVVEIGVNLVKVPQYITIAHVTTLALRGTRGIYLKTPCGSPLSIT